MNFNQGTMAYSCDEGGKVWQISFNQEVSSSPKMGQQRPTYIRL